MALDKNMINLRQEQIPFHVGAKAHKLLSFSLCDLFGNGN
jgi:hypothetical protein